MKKILLTLLAVTLSVGMASVAGTANADELETTEGCDTIIIRETGTGSENIAECEIELDVEVVCENGFYILTESSQEAISGATEELDNSTGGAAISGDATNENGLVVGIGSTCGPEEEEEVVPVTPETPVVPAGGAGEAKPVVVAKLPNTAASSTLQTVVASIVAVAVALVASRFAVAAYRRATLK